MTALRGDSEMRERFEKWADKHFLRIPVGINPIERDAEGRYKSGHVGAAWQAWQASTPSPEKLELAAEACAGQLFSDLKARELWKDKFAAILREHLGGKTE